MKNIVHTFDPFSAGSGCSQVVTLLVSKQKAVWIASYPRSGNTWVRAFLHNLVNEMSGCAERPHDINSLQDFTLLEANSPQFERHLGKRVGEASGSEIAAARPLVQADMVHGATAPVYIKTHNAVTFVEGHPTINFDVTLAAINIVRNPLDIAVSYANFYGVSIDTIIAYMADSQASIDTVGRRAHQFMGSWSFHVASWLSVPFRPVLTLRYEDLLTSPERTFGRLVSFLGFKPNAMQLHRALEHSSFSSLVRQEQARGFKEKPASCERFFRNGKKDQWRERLSSAQTQAVLRAHAPMMMRLGYVEERCS